MSHADSNYSDGGIMLDQDTMPTGLADQLNTTFAELERFQDLLRTQVEGLVSREAACAEQHAALQALEADLAQREQTLAARDEELNSRAAQVREFEQSAEQARVELEQRTQDLQQREEELTTRQTELEQAGSELNQAQQELESRGAQLDARGAELEQLQNTCSEHQEALLQKEAELEQQAAQLAEQTEALAAQQAAAAQRDNELAERAAAVDAQHQQVLEAIDELEKREAAMKEFQAAFKNIAAAFGGAGGAMPDMSAFAAMSAPSNAPSASGMRQAAEQLAAPLPPAPAADVPTYDPLAELAEPSDAAPIEPDYSRASSVAPEAAATEPTEQRIDESKLDPEVLKKLRVMRRLSGGRTSDQELLQRIYAELGAQSPESAKNDDKSRNKKRGWWKS